MLSEAISYEINKFSNEQKESFAKEEIINILLLLKEIAEEYEKKTEEMIENLEEENEDLMEEKESWSN